MERRPSDEPTSRIPEWYSAARALGRVAAEVEGERR